MTVDNDRLFKWGIVLLLAYPFLSLALSLFFLLPLSILNIFLPIEQGVMYLFTPARYACIAGILLLVAHYFRTAGRDEKGNRCVYGVLVLALLLGGIGSLLVFLKFSVTEMSPFYEGFVRYLYLGRFLCLGACAFGWAYGLWRLRIRWVLFCSVLVLVVRFLPQIPYNSPAYFESFGLPLDNAPTQSSSLETSEEQPIPDNEVIEKEEDTVDTVTTHTVVDFAPTMIFLFVLVYTWMRWGGTLLKGGSSGDGGNPDEIPHHAGGWLYVLGKTYLLLALPLVIVAAIGLSFLQTRVPLFNYNTAALLEAGLVIVTAGILLLVIPRLGRLSPERLDKTDRRLRQVLLFLLLFPLGSGLAIVYERMVGGTLNPYAATGFGSLIRVALQNVFLFAALMLWLWGVQKKHALYAVCGGIVFVSFLIPQAVLSSLYPQVPFSLKVDAFGYVEDSVWEESGADLLPGDAETSKSVAARNCERIDMPCGTNPVRLLFFPQYIRMHVTALLLFTLMRFWGDVFSRGKASPEEEPALT
ncbi:MAG: hypothetical protein GXY07_19375 [Candidatus Hydrogenedentes bacterium]|nr:hypothetical protein [Candidatus Hydrogenedentota bacterium]